MRCCCVKQLYCLEVCFAKPGILDFTIVTITGFGIKLPIQPLIFPPKWFGLQELSNHHACSNAKRQLCNWKHWSTAEPLSRQLTLYVIRASRRMLSVLPTRSGVWSLRANSPRNHFALTKCYRVLSGISFFLLTISASLYSILQTVWLSIITISFMPKQNYRGSHLKKSLPTLAKTHKFFRKENGFVQDEGDMCRTTIDKQNYWMVPELKIYATMSVSVTANKWRRFTDLSALKGR